MPAKHVLLVDDSKFVRTTFSRILSDTFEVIEAADGDAGWEAIQSDPSIVLVFCDFDMPKLDGFGLLARVRGSKDARVRKLPFIIITGHEGESIRRRARDSGANDFISKSADAPEVISRIEKQLRVVAASPEPKESKPAPAQSVTRGRTPGPLTLPSLVEEGRRLYSIARRDGGQLWAMSFLLDAAPGAAAQAGKTITDPLLDRIAKLATEMLTKESLLARAGDREFTVISGGAGATQALSFARHLREQLEKANEQIRVHFGISSVGADPASSIEDLMKLARDRLRKTAGGPPGVPVATPPALPIEVDRALQVLERVSPDRLGEASNEILRRLLPFLQGAFKRMQVDFPVDKVAQTLKGRKP